MPQNEMTHFKWGGSQICGSALNQNDHQSRHLGFVSPDTVFGLFINITITLRPQALPLPGE